MKVVLTPRSERSFYFECGKYSGVAYISKGEHGGEYYDQVEYLEFDDAEPDFETVDLITQKIECQI